MGKIARSNPSKGEQYEPEPHPVDRRDHCISLIAWSSKLLRVVTGFAEGPGSVAEFPLQFIDLIEYLHEMLAKLR